MSDKEIILALMSALAKRILVDLNATRPEGVWPNGQEWNELSNSSQGMLLDKACQEANLDFEQIMIKLNRDALKEAVFQWW